jgi:Tfp pilus assembly protein PilV
MWWPAIRRSAVKCGGQRAETCFVKGSLRALSRRIRRNDDAGFTLVEQVIALVVAALVFLAVAAIALSGMKATVMSRVNQQAIDVLNRSIEQARAMTYAELTMVSTDLASDTSITGTSPLVWNVPGVGSEAVDFHATGLVSPHVSTVTTNINGAVLTLKRYVTVPSSATYDTSGFPSVKRFTAVVTWKLYGQTKTRYDSTLITDTVRGLPLPNYTLRSIGPTSSSVNAGVVIDFGLAVHNLGARDAFDVTVSSTNPALTTGWTFYKDDGATGTGCSTPATAADGVRECGEDNLLTDTDGDGTPDTGYVQPNGDFYWVAERTSTSGDTGTVTFTTTSVAQPTASGATHTKDFTITISSGTVSGSTCPTTTSPTVTAPGGYSAVAFYLDNTPAGDTTNQLSVPLARADCTVQTASSMPDYSTDVAGSSSGRTLTPGGTVSSTDSTRAQWWWQPSSSDLHVSGTGTGSTATWGVLHLLVQCNTSGSATVYAAVGTQKKYDGSANGWTQQESGNATLGSCSGGWTSLDIPLSPTSSNWTVNKNGQPGYMSLRVWSSSTSPTMRLGYDWSSYMSYLVLAVNGG